ncbi:MAG: signal peptidase II [Kiritimatiellia bacterium]
MISNGFVMYERRPVIPGFFDLTRLHNTGAAWGMLSDHPEILAIVSIVMFILLVVFRRSILSDTTSHRWAYGLLIGGIVGNMIDRIKYGYVVDFLQFFIGEAHYPAFNIADSCICVGVGIYIASSFWIKSHPLNDKGKPT